jgi:lipoprotein NlpI
MKRHVLPLAALFLCASVQTPVMAQQTAVEFFDSGITKSKSNDFTGALQAFSMAISINPENSASYYNRGLAKANLEITGGPFWIMTKPSI